MSLKAYKHVWELDVTGADKLVMLAIADHADENGDCWIGYNRLSKITGLSDRHIKRVVKKLNKNGHIFVDINGGRGNANAYHIPLNGDTVSLFSDDKKGDMVSERVTSDTERVTSDTQKGDTMSPEPYRTINNHINARQKKERKPKKPPSEKQKDAQEMFSALANLCQYDLGLIRGEDRGKLNQAEAKMRENGYKPSDVKEFGYWWYKNDWRGKKGQPPTLSLIRTEWGKFIRSKKAAANVDLAANTYEGSYTLG